MRVFATALIVGAALAMGALAFLTQSEPAAAMTLRLNPIGDVTPSADTALPIQDFVPV